jgi:hypothetical protein
MNRQLKRGTLKTSPILRTALTLYLALFFVSILPGHDLSHAHATFSDRITVADRSAHSGLNSHNADQCQICRTHGQLDAVSVRTGQEINRTSRPLVAKDSGVAPFSALFSHLSPRSPPAVG